MRVNLLCRALPSDVRLGYDKARARDFQWLFTNQRVPPAKEQHALDAMMSFATAIGATEQPLRWDLPLSADAEQFAAKHTDSAQPTVVISPCSSQRSRNFRNWSIGHYAAVIRHLQERHHCRVVLTGGNSDLEKEYGQALCNDAAPGLANLVGQSTLPQLAALIRAADLVICPDSGPAHIATAVGTRVIGLYATSNPERTGPYLSQDLTVNRYPEAARKNLGKDVREPRWGTRASPRGDGPDHGRRRW